MPDKEKHDGFFVSNRLIGIIILGMLGGGGAIGVGGFTLSNGASEAATEDIRQTIQAVIQSEAMLTPEEAEIWADERDLHKHQQELIDDTLVRHTEDIAELKEDVFMVQQTATANQAILRDIADTVGVTP